MSRLLKKQALILCLFMPLLSSCAVFSGKAEPVAVFPNVRSAEYSGLKKIAVLPFYNYSSRKEATKIITNIYVSELFKTGRYRVEEPGNVRQLYIQERVSALGELDLDRLKVLGLRLGVDGVIIGVVETFSNSDKLRGEPVVSITARLVDTIEGDVIWSYQIKRYGKDYVYIFDFGEIRSASTLAKEVIREMIDTLTW